MTVEQIKTEDDLTGIIPSKPDFFVEADKAGDWYIVEIDHDDYTSRDFPIGPFPSKVHAINEGIRLFWHNNNG